jgi:transcriptional antiterminator RfaH
MTMNEDLELWYVLHLRSRCEKKVQEFAQAANLKHYLPLRVESKIYQRRKVTVSKPVFPGYVFAAFNHEGRNALLKTNSIVRIIPALNQDQLLFELDQVSKAISIDKTLGAADMFEKGRHARIIGGPFQGIEGVISDSNQYPKKIWLNVEMIGRSVPVAVEPEYLEIVE